MGYGVVARIFHWGTVLMVLVMIPVGLIMTQDVPRYIQDPLFILHKGLGVAVLTVVLLRIAWRVANPPPPLPVSLPRAQRLVAEATHVALYALLLAMAVSGYVRVTSGGFPLEALDALGVPPLLGKDKALSEAASQFHQFAAFALIALIALHVAAASYHGLVRRDGIVSRMWPPFSA
ncbi:cytochrome b/b6 domain-containing protein [Amaricoccus sp.]|uniref:cytochrome b n=1 Tax=Amaricoccus sp. TaxID=1872485 RepID=UPI001B67F8FF|nr:cytochrome b/b6 domain-containing protein [Amaricoccus sp.]MBP7002810.1 cytochrome b [Amaricoccus sp.]